MYYKKYKKKRNQFTHQVDSSATVKVVENTTLKTPLKKIVLQTLIPKRRTENLKMM